MKHYLSFRNLLLSLIAIIFFSSCSKEVTTPPPPPPPCPSCDTPFHVTSSNTFYVYANNWVKLSAKDYKCTFYGVNGYGNNITGNVRVFLIVQNMETIISTGSVHFMNGELSADHDALSVWVIFHSSADIESLPFTSLQFKIVFV